MTQPTNLSPPQFPYPWASDWGEDRYGLWQGFTYAGIRHAFRWIPPGRFMMGSLEDEDLHEVTLSQGFWLAETTVTQALWQAVMSDIPSHFKGEHRPVETVSWDDAQSFITQLHQKIPGLLTRLPWEAEWEYACRAGTQTPFNFSGDLTLAKVNYRGTWDFDPDKWGDGAKQETADVKSYPCNAWGLYEMHGNVWEWCADAWLDHLGAAAITDPWQLSDSTTSGALRVLRGGSWSGSGRGARSANRSRSTPGHRNDLLGFRLALGHSNKG